MSIIDSNVKELLSRFAANTVEEIPSSIITPELERVISDIYKARAELHKPNVLTAVYKMHPEYLHSIISEEVSTDDLIYICENNHIKNTLIEFDLKLTDSLVRQKDNPLFNWQELSENLLGTLKPKGINKLYYLDELDFEEERVVASWGYPTLDQWLEGGITESSYTIFYAGCVSGDTLVQAVQGNSCARFKTIEKLYHSYHNIPFPGKGNSVKSSNKNKQWRILSLDEATGSLKYNNILNVLKTGKKVVYEVTTESGQTIKTTEDHKFYIGDCFKKLAELSVGDLICVKAFGKHTYKTQENNSEYFVKRHPTKKINKRSNGEYYYVRILNYHAIYEANLNNLTLGEYLKLLNSDEDISKLQTIPLGYHIHHIDGNHDNNNLNNLQLVTASEHRKYHSASSPIGYVKDRIISITEIGLVDTYDVCCESPNNNYIANNIVVHNSSVGKSQAVTIQLSANLIKQGKIPLIIALEGSPKKFITKIVATIAGLADIDPRHYTPEHKELLKSVSKTLPHIPIINRGCSKRWEIEKYINIFKPDVLIYDQITISGNGRDWEKMANVSETLKQISINLGVPVVAVTQSSEKNYNNSSEVGEDDLKTQDFIKYSSAIFEDATHVVEIKLHEQGSPVRSFTIRKTKDDNTSRLLPLRLIVELTPAGFVERYFRTSCGTKYDLNLDPNQKPIRDDIDIEEPRTKFKLRRG